MSMVVQHINPKNSFLHRCPFPSKITEYKVVNGWDFGIHKTQILMNGLDIGLFYYHLFDTPNGEHFFQGKCEGSVFLACHDFRYVLYMFLFHPCIS